MDGIDGTLGGCRIPMSARLIPMGRYVGYQSDAGRDHVRHGIDALAA